MTLAYVDESQKTCNSSDPNPNGSNKYIRYLEETTAWGTNGANAVSLSAASLWSFWNSLKIFWKSLASFASAIFLFAYNSIQWLSRRKKKENNAYFPHNKERQVDGSVNVEKDGATNLSIHRNVSFLYLEGWVQWPSSDPILVAASCTSSEQGTAMNALTWTCAYSHFPTI